MKFSDITSAVHEGWRFSWPPLVACGLAYWIMGTLYPTGLAVCLSDTHQTLTVLGRQILAIRETIEPFGLATFVPLVALICVVAFLYLVSMAALHWTSILPPHLSYSPDCLLFAQISEKEMLLLFRRYPIASHFNAAFYMALGEHGVKDEAQERKSEIFYRLQSFAKFTVCVVLIVLFASIGTGDLSFNRFAAALLIIVASFVVWGCALVGVLYEQEQEFSREWSLVRAALQDGAAELLSKEITDEEKQRLKEQVSNAWWRVYAFDRYRVEWLKRTFLPSARSTRSKV